MNKKMIVILCTIIVVMITIFISTGFNKRTDVVLLDYSLADGGTDLNINVAVSSSMGCVRGTGIKNNGSNKYITFYSTFGFLNSKLGAKSEFEIDIDSTTEEIYFYKGNGEYDLVLKRNKETNKWDKVI